MDLGIKEDMLIFLNTTQSGQVNVERGISLESFLSSMTFSIIFCMLQMTLFIYLRGQYPNFYYYYNNYKPTKNKIFNWKLFNPFNYLDITGFKSKIGTDAYLLLRFLYISLYMFVGISIVSVTVLLPVNYCFGIHNDQITSRGIQSVMGDTNTRGLDLISISNVSVQHTDKCVYHFFVCIFIIIWFHHVLIQEFNYSIKLKQTSLIEMSHDPHTNERMRTMYVGNINLKKYKTADDLTNLFNSLIPNCVESTFPIHDFRELAGMVIAFKYFHNKLEEYLCKYISNPDDLKIQSLCLPTYLGGFIKTKIPSICSLVSTYPYLIYQIQRYSCSINNLRLDILSDDSTFTMDKAFVKFRRISDAYTLRQILISDDPKFMNLSLIEVEPRGINWNNVMRTNGTLKFCFRNIILFLISMILIICWVIPVAFVGSVSQLPYLISLIPTISWIYKLPNIIKAFIASILPTVILTLLTTLALQIFKILTKKKRKLTGCSEQLSIQRWFFIFLFFQLFIVISISSGFVAVIEKLFYNPISIPLIVASDLPKTSTFFFPFFLLRGLSLFSTNLLQFYNFLREVVIFPKLVDLTPRQTSARADERHSNKLCLAQVYPIFSVYGSIGIVYSVISPLITIFCCLNFVIDIIAFKFTLKYTMNKVNVNETHGKLYTLALRQMYAGIYSLEVYMMGLLFTVKGENGTRVCSNYGFLMLIITMGTIYVHISINKRFDSQMNVMPLELFNLMENKEDAEQTMAQQQQRMEYLHPSFRFSPDSWSIWLPDKGDERVKALVVDRLNNDGIKVTVN